MHITGKVSLQKPALSLLLKQTTLLTFGLSPHTGMHLQRLQGVVRVPHLERAKLAQNYAGLSLRQPSPEEGALTMVPAHYRV
eukprot:3156678-Amphidinium_carterae.1